MLKDWHKEDIIEALKTRNWEGPTPLAHSYPYEVGEACRFTRNRATLDLFFVADLGTGFTGKKSLESVIAHPSWGGTYELWLHRIRDAKWKKELFDWADNFQASVRRK